MSIVRTSFSAFLQTVVLPPGLGHPLVFDDHRLTYLTSRELMGKVGAIYDQPQTNREPDAAESANQKRAAVALSAC